MAGPRTVFGLWRCLPGRCLSAKLVELAESAGQDNLSDGRRDTLADSGEAGQVGFVAGHLVETLPEGTDAGGGPPIGLHLERVFVLR